ncbi:Molybdenum cofactor synthesis domain protein [uncultured Desulfobacterium sp.]|uniref:Molybdopterin molybdenumtransferase n=1 Tax=uncultured Desulfobacterium sp. TaxID=201089 RepID=A0A445MSU3_9BACT|nr:Molybdenum cofactor synthesis domain protein [uncultured Desulfobacterium sp.]
MKRQVYLEMKSLEQARDLFFSRINLEQIRAVECVSAEDSLGRTTSEAVFAKLSAPSFHSAAMDGIALRAERTYGTTERNPRVLSLEEDFAWINTGQPLPEQFDAVIMVEKLHEVDEEHVELRSPAHPWQNVRKVGEDIVATQLLFPKNHCIRPYDIGGLVSAGVFSVKVWKRPLVAIIPTGSELVSYNALSGTEGLSGNRLIEYNSHVLAALVREAGGIPLVYDIVPDSEEQIALTLKKAVESEAVTVIINAGSSSGSKDYTVHVIRDIGEVLVHGVAMMPGKPTILGMVNGKPVVGNPGYAVSSILSFEQFIKPLLHMLQGNHPPGRKTIKVWPTRDIPSKLGTEEFLRVSIGRVGERYVATPLERAAGSITTLIRAEGIIRIPALMEGVTQRSQVEAELLVDEHELEDTVVIIGSHDITIDILADEIRQRGYDIRVSSGNVGSLGGLIALKKETCHMAGSHLLDTETGEYNISYINKYLKGVGISVFNLVLRDQGLIIPKGNPKGIRGIEDLERQDITFVNRQAGSGTRILLDFRLRQLGIDPAHVRGYDHEEYTHMAVAVDVLSGAADCGLGIFAAARALDLDFIPVEREQYDLIIPSEIINQSKIQSVLDTIRSKNFRNRVTALGGYDPGNSGNLWKEIV